MRSSACKINRMTSLEENLIAPQTTKPWILLVDNDRSTINILYNLLKPEYRIKVGMNGEQALKRATTPPYPEMILLDVLMPDMNGLEVCRRLKAISQTRETPIIFITSQGAETDEVRGLECGAVDFISKPIRATLIRSRVKNQMIQLQQKQELELRTAELHKAKEAAELANRSKSKFLAQMSHELRTPLTTMLGASRLLEQEPLSKEGSIWLKRMQQAGDQLQGQIQDVLDLSRIEGGHLELSSTPFNIVTLLGEIIDTMRLEAEQQQIELSLNMDEAPPIPQLKGDEMRIRQIISNLLTNAIKYAPGAPVTLYLQGELLETQHFILDISVEDHGPGISEAQLNSLFEMFQRAAPTGTSGFGIGLSICKQLVEKMGGEIGVESQLGRGSRFWLHLPLELDQSTPQPSSPPLTHHAPRSILLAEDHPVNREIISQLLQAEGHRVMTVSNGVEALDAVTQHSFDLLLMDLRMPVMGGLEATQAIRSQQNGRTGKLEIVGLTADVTGESFDACLAAGMEHVLPKPFDMHTLHRYWKGNTTAPLKQQMDTLPLQQEWAESLGETALTKLQQMQHHSLLQLMKALEQYWQQDHWQQSADCAHQIAGVAAMVGATQLQQKALKIEQESRQAQSLPPKPVLEQLQLEYTQLKSRTP